jgi:hypothetical protein
MPPKKTDAAIVQLVTEESLQIDNS